MTARGCEVELSKNGECILTGARRWKLEQGPGQSFLTAESLRDVSKTLLYDEITPLEVSLIPVSETEAFLPAEQDKKKHEPFDLPIEIRAPQVKRGPRDSTDDEVTQHEPLQLQFRNWCPIFIESFGTDDPHHRRGEAEPSDPQVQLDFLFLTGNKHGDTQPTITVLVLVETRLSLCAQAWTVGDTPMCRHTTKRLVL